MFRRDKFAFCGAMPRRLCGPHFALIGPTGSGKTLLLRALLATALFHRGRLASSAIIGDIKGDWLAILAAYDKSITRSVRVTDPMLELCSEVPSLAHDVTDATSAQVLSEAIIPKKESLTQPFFDDASRAILSSTVQALQLLSPGCWTLDDVVRITLSPPLLVATLERVPYLLERVRSTLSAAAEGQAAGVLASLMTHLEPLAPLAACAARIPGRFSLDAHIRDDASPRLLLLSSDSRHEVGLRALNRIYFELAARTIEAMPEVEEGDEKLWVVLDENPAHGRLPRLANLMRTSRTKGTRICLATQGLAADAGVYGGERAAFELYGNCASLAFTNPVSGMSEQFMHQQMGQQEVIRTSTSEQHGGSGYSSSESHSVTTAQPVSSSAFSTLGGPSKRNGVPAVVRCDSMWSADRVAPSFLRRFLRPVDRGLIEAAKQRRPATFLQPQPFTQQDAERLSLRWPLPAVAEGELFGVRLEPNHPQPLRVL